ncbi:MULTISPECIES: right-handed parallel beta-helix repeat-containing protein [Bacillus]|uniref:right-handed parallel beta-helix repeat-containing protein n=1 Tax=Bacillus TaxID=1386 RepID=UPI000C765172|nr:MULTISPECIES: right-handed parallel beta-helix repeat-containing protein [Bacillus]PLR85788.1 hypothetical protein CVD23_07570 [Bacillus sp. V33-4]RSK44049.1 hypothetical protein EJA13_20760 [Bacillus canaveralius]
MAQQIIVAPGQSIQAAINAANPFDTIRVLPGTYTETININKTIQLLGAQAGVDARTRTGAPGTESIITGSTASGGTVQLTADNAVFDGFTVQGNTLTAGVATSSAASGYWVLNNISQDNVIGMFIGSNGATETQIRQNVIFNNNRPGASTGTGIYSDTGASNVLIESNRFAGPHQTSSITFINASDLVITRNELLTDNSLSLFGTTNVEVACNTITNSTESGIFFGGGTNLTDVYNNIVQNSGSSGINVFDVGFGTNTNIRAKNNNIQNNAGAGLNIQPGAYDDVSGRRLDATNNWWGSPTGPTSPANPGGTGDEVNDPDNVAEITPFLQAPPNPCSADLACLQQLAATQQALTATQQAFAALQQAFISLQQTLALVRQQLAVCMGQFRNKPDCPKRKKNSCKSCQH